MKIIETDINSLIPYEFNNKVHDEDQIKVKPFIIVLGVYKEPGRWWSLLLL